MISILRQRWLPLAVFVFLIGSVALYFLLDPHIPEERQTAENLQPVMSFDHAILVGRRAGEPQWELRGSNMVTDNGDVVIETLDELLLLRSGGAPYRILSSSGRWNAQDGILVLPNATTIEEEDGFRTEAGSLVWQRDDGLTVLEGDVRMLQDRTLVSSGRASFQPDSGMFTMFGDVEITWTEGDDDL